MNSTLASILFAALLVPVAFDIRSTMGCLKSERQALLMLKRDFIDESNRLSSWVDGGNCCHWDGVVCGNSTVHVIGLNLQANPYDSDTGPSHDANVNTQLGGTLSPSLLHLKHLIQLNLSGNDFGGTRIPSFIGSMTSLKYLDLSYAGFGGQIPPQIGNITNLSYLGLAGSSLSSSNLHWLSNLSSLRRLHWHSIDLSMAKDWLHSLNTIPSIKELILSNCQLAHPTSRPLVNNLSSLSVMDLSENNLDNPLVSKWISQFHHLNTLDLHDCYFQPGPIRDGLRNLTRLRSLTLSYNNFNSSIPNWLYNSTNRLQILDLSHNNLQGVISSAVGSLTSIIELSLSGNVDLRFEGPETVRSMGQLCILESLELSKMKVNQHVADIFNHLFSSCPSNGLETIDLESAGIFGDLSDVSFEKFKSLANLYLQNNSITGSIPPSFGELQSLESFNIQENSMVGVITEAHFAKLAKLKTFRADSNKQLELKVSTSWVPSFQLTELSLTSWKLGKRFPNWLRTQRNIQSLVLSNCEIEDIIPNWFWNLSLPLGELVLSGNRIFGEIRGLVGQTFQNGAQVDLKSNQLTGQVPVFSSKVNYLDLSNNSFESVSKGFWNFTKSLVYLLLDNNRIVGEVPSLAAAANAAIDLSSNYFYGEVPPFSSNLVALDISNNSFSGSISNFLCHESNELKYLEVLNLGDNLLSGEIPNCWNPWNSLTTVKLDNNNFTGSIPASMKNLSRLESLHARNNNLKGELFFLLRNNQNLVSLDLAENHFEEEIPGWVGKSNLTILDIRSNKLQGKIPKEICLLTSLQVLDFASNNLYGSIPRCIGNLVAMATSGSVENQFKEDDLSWESGGYSYLEKAIVLMKGRVMEYGRTLDLVRLIDLSDNALSGQIPAGMTSLVALQSLNLSHNILTGEIPRGVGSMKEMESLDLSMNKLSGEIPGSITNLTFLSYLNLSNNYLTGAIPSSTQLQGFNASCFAGNDLCGPPLATSCIPITRNATGGSADDDDSNDDVKWLFVSMAFGFVVGFWVVVFPIFFSRRWRFAVFRILDRIWAFLDAMFLLLYLSLKG